jgi:hypothetical protein
MDGIGIGDWLLVIELLVTGNSLLVAIVMGSLVTDN